MPDTNTVLNTNNLNPILRTESLRYAHGLYIEKPVLGSEEAVILIPDGNLEAAEVYGNGDSITISDIRKKGFDKAVHISLSNFTYNCGLRVWLTDTDDARVQMNLKFDINVRPTRKSVKKILLDNIKNISIPVKNCLCELGLSGKYSVADFSRLQTDAVDAIKRKLEELDYLEVDLTYISEEFNDIAQKIIDTNKKIHEAKLVEKENEHKNSAELQNMFQENNKREAEEEYQHQMKVKQADNENLLKHQEINNSRELGKEIKKLINEIGEAAASALSPEARKVVDRKHQIEREKLELFEKEVKVISNMMKDGAIDEEMAEKMVNRFFAGTYGEAGAIGAENVISGDNVMHQLDVWHNCEGTDDEDITEDDENIR